MSELMLDVGQANELKLAFRRADWTGADIKKFCEGDLALKLLPVVRGNGDVVIVKHIIDMDAPSTKVSANWKVLEKDQLPNRLQGKVEWNSADSSLFLSEKQKSSYSVGTDLQKELEKLEVQHVTDAVIDHYLNHPEIPTPKEWLGKWIFAWGRIYRDALDYLVVRCLFCSDGSRYGSYYYVGYYFFSDDPALVVAGKS